MDILAFTKIITALFHKIESFNNLYWLLRSTHFLLNFKEATSITDQNSYFYKMHLFYLNAGVFSQSPIVIIQVVNPLLGL
jgi:hypothetical protein